MVVQALIHFNQTIGEGQALDLVKYLLQKNESLRTHLVDEKGFVYPLQEIRPVEQCLDHLKVVKGNLQVAQELQKESFKHVDRSTPIAIDVVQSDNEAWISLTVSSYNIDSYSFKILCKQVHKYLAGQGEEPSEDDVTYLEFANWQEELSEELTQEERDFWERYPIEPSSYFKLQTQNSSPNVACGKGLQTFVVPPAVVSKLRASYSHNIEEVLLTLWATVLAKHNKYTPLTLGYIPHARTFPEISSLVGSLSTALPLTINFDGKASLVEMMDQVKSGLEELQANQYHYMLCQEGQLSSAIEVAVGFEYMDVSKEKDSEYQMDHLCTHHDHHVIKLLAFDYHGPLTLQLQYDKNAYTGAAVSTLYKQFMAVLESLLHRPEVPLQAVSLTEEDDHEVKNIGVGEQYSLKHLTVPGLISELVQDNPEKTAITFNGKDISYRDLHLQSDQVAQKLITQYNIALNDKIGVFMERSDVLIVMLLGIIKSGAAYVPVDPNDSQARVEYIVNDSQCKLMVKDSTSYEMELVDVQVAEPSDLLEGTFDPVDLPILKKTDPIYMIYTSGTSGRLKGVPVRHESLLNYVNWIQQTLGISGTDSSALISSHAFDLGYTSLWGTLLSGGSLHIVPEYLIQTPEVLVQQLAGHGVTYLKTTPSMFNLLLSEADRSIKGLLKGLRLLILGGEKVRVEDLEKIWDMAPDLKVINHYGPTETTVGVLAHELDKTRVEYYRNHSIIGKPAYNHSVFVLDAQYEPCPPGVCGEIYISGLGLSQGYHNMEEVTRERFITHPKWNIVCYKTGDEGYWNEHNELAFVGRLDNQVKINGYRVELSEITDAVKQVPTVDDAVVCYLDGKNNHILACYYVSEEFIEQVVFRNALGDLLPKYMIPAAYRRIPSIPLTINGKVDQGALPPITEGRGLDAQGAEASNELEGIVLSICRDVLGNDSVGVYDNFFERGGDSIKAIQIASRLHNVGYTIHVSDIFNNPTVADMTLMVKKAVVDQNEKDVQGPIPMTPVFHYFFENIKKNPNHYNQSFWLDVGAYGIDELSPVFEKVMEYHDILRLTFKRNTEGKLRPHIRPVGDTLEIGFSELKETESVADIEAFANELQAKFDLEEGSLIRAHLLQKDDANFLLVIMHHLVTDVVSWGILINDLRNLLTQQTQGGPLSLPPKTSSYGDWANKLNEYAEEDVIRRQLPYWSQVPLTVPSPVEKPEGSNEIKDVHSVTFSLSAEETEKFVQQHGTKEAVQISVYIITAMGMAFQKVFNTDESLLMLESHGREEVDGAINIYRTLGWFTALYPFYFKLTGGDVLDNLNHVNAAFQKIPQKGIGYGLLRYLTEQGKIELQHRPSIRFNYLGDHVEGSSDQELRILDYPSGATEDINEPRPFEVDVIAYISSGELHLHLSYSSQQFNRQKMDGLMDVFKTCLIEAIDIEGLHTEEKTLSENLTYNKLSQEDLENFF